MTILENYLDEIQGDTQKILQLFPTADEFKKIKEAKEFYETNYADIKANAEKYRHSKDFFKMPWGIAYSIFKNHNKEKLIRYIFIAIALDWQDLIKEFKRTCQNMGITKQDLEAIAQTIWAPDFDKLTSLTEDYQTCTKILKEKIEKHDKLNPKLWNKNNELKKAVKDKIKLIVDTFIKDLAEDGIDIDIDDIVLIGSNCSYNYNKDSDLDVHLLVNTDKLNCPDNLYPKLYSAYRSLFSKNYDITFYGIPVELFIETQDTPAVSNGMYSVLKDTWIKEPDIDGIPEIDEAQLESQTAVWKKRYEKLKKAAEKKSDDLKVCDDIEQFLEDIYAVRKDALASEGEYGLGNLIFKALRNDGILDDLKALKLMLRGNALSLESLHESITQEISNDYQELSKLYGVDLQELVYGPNGFMQNKYPNGFPDFSGDVIYSMKYWKEFTDWCKQNNIVLKQPGMEDLFELNEGVSLTDPSLSKGIAYLNKYPKAYGYVCSYTNAKTKQQVAVNKGFMTENDLHNFEAALERAYPDIVGINVIRQGEQAKYQSALDNK